MRSGDAWQDFGLVGFYRDIDKKVDPFYPDTEYRSLIDIEIKEDRVELTWDSQQEEVVKKLLYECLQERLNQAWVMPMEIRLLNVNWFDACKKSGWVDKDHQWTLTDEQVATLKSGELSFALKYAKKQVKPQPMRSFAGTNTDWKFTVDTLHEVIDQFIFHFSDQEKKRKTCPLCGEKGVSGHFKDTKQKYNLFFNQHHAVAVRNVQSTVASSSMCTVCHMLNLYSSLLLVERPYFEENEVHILLPETNDLRTLESLIQTFKEKLVDYAQPALKSYQTNIKDFWHRTIYNSLIQVYYLFHTANEAEAAADPDLPIEDQFAYSLHHWNIIKLDRGQNIQAREVYRIPVGHQQIALAQNIPFGTQGREGNVVENFFRKLICPNKRVLDQLAKGVFTKDLNLLSYALYSYYNEMSKKKEEYYITDRAILFFVDFVESRLSVKEEETMTENIMKIIRSISFAIGTNVNEDVGVLTRLNTAISPEQLGQALLELTFRMVKSTVKDEKKVRLIKAEDMELLLEELSNPKHFPIVRQRLLIFINLYAINAIKHKNPKKEESVQ